MFKRVVIKISGEVLGDSINPSNKFDTKMINRIISEVKELLENCVQVSLVVGGGNFWRGREAESNMDKVSADQIGILATIMNGIYLADSFNQNGIKAVVMTPFDINAFTEKFTKTKALKYMNKGNVVIFAGGTGHPFFSTDTIVALRASELEADAVLFAKNIDGVYTEDPNKNNKAKKYKTLSYKEVLSKALDLADFSAMHLMYKNNISCVVFALYIENSIVIACEDSDEIFKIGGTKISNKLEETYYE